MQVSSKLIYRVNSDGSYSPASRNWVSSIVNSGNIFIIRNALQEINLYSEILTLVYQVIGNTFGQKILNSIKKDGLDQLHRHLDASQLLRLHEKLTQVLNPLSLTIGKRFGNKIFARDKDFYVEDQPNYRIFIPHDIYMNSEDKYEQYGIQNGPGKLTLHGPHHDSWYYHPLNAINVWTAITPVKKGNGLCLWPSVWGKRLPLDSKHRIKRNQYYGRALNFELKTGDAIVFSSEHLHASELNRTEQTRFVFSFRMSMEKPVYYGAEVYNYTPSKVIRDLYTDASDSVSAKKLIMEDKQRRQDFLKKRNMKYIPRDNKVPPTDDLSADFPDTLQVLIDEVSKTATFEIDKLNEGKVKVINNHICVANDHGKIYAFSRICPHQYADLVTGYIDNGKVFCPWHNLAINLQTGKSDCRTLGKIRIYPTRSEGTKVIIDLSKNNTEETVPEQKHLI